MENSKISTDIKKYLDRVLAGYDLNFDEAIELTQTGDPVELFRAADQLRQRFHNNSLDLCSIVNAKSGRCTEDCKFCAQSSHHNVEIVTYDMVDINEAVSLAKENELAGVRRFSLVTAGRTISTKNLEELQKIYLRLQDDTKLSLCASMGLLTPDNALALKNMGVCRYHCNLETSRSFFPKVCTSHSWDEKVATIKIAREAGLDVCSGGIIGMGESFEQRLELAFELRELNIFSIPLNILAPIKKTPFEGVRPLTIGEILTCVAIFRFINPKAIIRIAGGRNQLGPDQKACFTSGANGAIVGNYLTTSGNSLEEDIEMFRSLDFEFG